VDEALAEAIGALKSTAGLVHSAQLADVLRSDGPNDFHVVGIDLFLRVLNEEVLYLKRWPDTEGFVAKY